ncbi:peptidyl-tRNA hydrolase-like protein [Elsinoe australis]|uniref:peptidyl-tRNA hydrolase n=1 Tax=Elsinoe australis TaxID=40998 RepID=A0A4U7B8U1_9PEZI|nr:peptidyl-tRNA hydrolase-like protein [Elsinoe australis]
MPPSLLLISLGNPGPRYALTRHSAAHILLNSLATSLSAPPFLPSPLSPSPRDPGRSTTIPAPLPPPKKPRRAPNSPPSFAEEYGFSPASGADPVVQEGLQPQWTLHQCASYMNVSGPEVAHAWRCFLAEGPGEAKDKRLVVLHDSLEDEVGRVRVQRDGGGVSARGHNGIKSILETFKRREAREGKGKVGTGAAGGSVGEGTKGWIRVNIGVGRPRSRDPDDVARYVLQEFGQGELEVLRGRTTREVLRVLKEIK